MNNFKNSLPNSNDLHQSIPKVKKMKVITLYGLTRISQFYMSLIDICFNSALMQHCFYTIKKKKNSN